MEVRGGVGLAGVPATVKRELRPAVEKDDPNPVAFFLHFGARFVIGILYGLALAIFRTFTRLLLFKPVSVKGRVCFVSGSGRGLGRDICLELARNGAVLALADINETTNRETLQMVEKLGAKAKMYPLNISNKQEVDATVSRIEKELGPVYLIVNNAAIVMPMYEPTEEYTRATFNVNVLGHIWVTRAFLPYLKERNDGHIINIGSVSSYHGMDGFEEYSASKAAIRSYSQTLLTTFRRENLNIKVTCINPTMINTTEDYETLLKSSIQFLSTKNVVDGLMWAVKYDLSSDFSVPFYMKFGFLLILMFPIEALMYLFKSTNSVVILPTEPEFNNFPAGQIVRLCAEKGSTTNGAVKSGDLKKD